jgi:hypothetical protein
VCEEGEVIALCDKRITVYAMVAGVKKVANDLSVASQLCMDIPNIVVLVTVKTVVVIVAALVRAEFLIRPAQELCSAVKTYSFHSKLFCQSY